MAVKVLSFTVTVPGSVKSYAQIGLQSLKNRVIRQWRHHRE